MPRVKGSAALARLRYATEFYGDLGRDSLLQALEPGHRKLLLEETLPQSWVPFELFVDLNVKADRIFGNGDLTLCYHMGRFGADVNLTTIYRIFYKLGNPSFIIRRAANVWSMNYDSGRLLIDETGENELSVRIDDFATPHRAHCLSVLGWAARSVELSGGNLQNAIEVSCRGRGQAKCELLFRWT